MRIVFIGTVNFSLQMLRTLIKEKAEVVGVITAKTSGDNSDFADLKPLCDKYRLSLLTTNDINSVETIAWIKSKEPEVIFCMGWSRLIKKELLQLTPMGVVGFHPAALPINRGRHPLIWALALGLKETASTFFFMGESADDGDILSQVSFKIKDADDANSLYQRVIEIAKRQTAELLPLLAKKTYSRTTQNHSLANIWRKRGMKDGEIDWRMAADSIHNLVRALTHPYVGAHLIHREQIYKVWKTREIERAGLDNIEPGKIIDVLPSGNVVIKCGHGGIELLDVDPKLAVEKGAYL